MPSITIRNLTKQYNGEDGQAVTALDHIDLHIKDGEFVCIVGPSGCGKSTMLEIVAGLLEKSGGHRTQPGYRCGISGCVPVSVENGEEKYRFRHGYLEGTQGRAGRAAEKIYPSDEPGRF